MEKILLLSPLVLGDDYRIDSEKILKISRNVVGVGGVGIGLVGIFGKYILEIMPRDYHVISDYLPALFLFPMVYVVSEIYSVSIKIERQAGLLPLVSLLTIIVCVILNSLLVPIFGIEGAIVSQSLSVCFYMLLRMLMGKYFNRQLRFEFLLAWIGLILVISYLPMTGYVGDWEFSVLQIVQIFFCFYCLGVKNLFSSPKS